VRVADVTFSVIHAGQPINCEAKSLDIGDGAYEAKPGDSVELSPIPDSCARPYVINIQPPTWLMGPVYAIVVAAGFLFALLTWGASNPESKLGSWVTNKF
jgi:hypothetical protein